MKFTSEDLMKAIKLQVGDRVKCIFMGGKDEGLGGQILELKKSCKGYISLIGEDECQYPLSILLNRDIEILPRSQRVGDLKCGECDCASCPLRGIDCRNVPTRTKNTLYEILDKYFEEYPDQEIYNLLKARLDKEVKEC